MTTRISGGMPLDDDEQGRPMDLAALHEDDLLLDRLGRGEEPVDGNAVASALSRWRAALPSGDPAGPQDDELLAAALARVRPPRAGRIARRSAILSAVAVLAFGAVAAAAERAGPGSPLWPLTELMFHDHAEARAAADAAADSVNAARVSIDGGSYGQASRLLDDAEASVARIGAGAEADRLREEIEALRALIPADTGGAATVPTRPVPSEGMPSLDVPRTDLPPSPVESPSATPQPPAIGPTAGPPTPPAPPGTVGIAPPLVSVGPLLPTSSLPMVFDGLVGLVR
jgi:hypothetical protein